VSGLLIQKQSPASPELFILNDNRCTAIVLKIKWRHLLLAIKIVEPDCRAAWCLHHHVATRDARVPPYQ
jgi:hypothetical protein